MTTSLTLEERIQMDQAWGYLRQGYLEKAEKALLRLGPTSLLYSVGLGYVSFLRDDYPAAEDNFKQAVKDVPDSLLAHLGLAQLYQKTGDEDKTFNELREVLKLDPVNIWAKEQYENLKARKTDEVVAEAKDAVARGDLEKGKQGYLRALHYSPEATKIHLALADIYKKENKTSNALVHLKTAAAGDPTNSAILEEYAETLAEAKQYERSLDVYQQVLELDGGNKKASQQVEILKNKLGIFELPSKYNDIPMSPAVTREDLAALLAIKLREVLPEIPAQPPIIIDISASWASKFILKVTSLGLLEVYTNHSFQPKRTVTRGELAGTVFRVIEYLQDEGHKFVRQISPDRISLQDVTPDYYFFQPIIQVLSYQIMELYPDRTFRPDQPVPGPEAVRTINILLALVR
jgi:Tfp pilus assembly protein PilF